jgi:uncharacterized protein (TIGR02001 family)
MKKLTAFLAASVAGVSIVHAQELSISSTFSWESDYVFRGVQLAEEYFAPAVDISYGDAYAGIWAALPVDSQFGNEVDFYAGYGLGLSETVSADVGFCYYTYPDAGSDFFDDVNTLEVYGGLSFDAPLSPAVYAYYDLDLEILTFEASAGHSSEVSESATFDISAYIGYVDPNEGDTYTYYGASVGYTYAFTDNAAFTIGMNWYSSSEDYMYDGDSDALTFGTSFTAGF